MRFTSVYENISQTIEGEDPKLSGLKTVVHDFFDQFPRGKNPYLMVFLSRNPKQTHRHTVFHEIILISAWAKVPGINVGVKETNFYYAH